MRRALAAAAAICMLASPVLAQDETKWNHGGAYAGLAAGYSAAVLQSSDPIDWGASGLMGGAYAGYGFLGRSGVYVGVELDATLKDIKWKASDGGGTTVEASGRWLGSFRARVGQALGPMLLYATGGLALTDQKIAVTGIGSDTEWRYGWVAGVGAEAMLTKTVTLRLEGLHYDFAEKGFNLGGLGTEKLGTQENVVRVGVSFKLN